MSIKLSQLADMLYEHIEKYGDSNLMIFDDYSSVYKSVSRNDISRTHGDKFVIECREE